MLGDFSLTLIDSLDMLAVMGNTSEFRRAVRLVVDTVHFDKSNTVQVGEIHCMSALLISTSTDILISKSPLLLAFMIF